jgi:signal peptidase I
MAGLRDLPRRAASWLEEKAPRVHHFLTRQDKPYPFVRDVLGIALVLLFLGTLLWGFTGQGIGDAPVVVVESSSMMHCHNGPYPQNLDVRGSVCKRGTYGRFGTIDAGDLIFLKDIDGTKDVTTFLDAQDGGRRGYGMAGDVIVFRSNGATGTPIIHRAMFYLQINADGTFTIPEIGRTFADAHDLRDNLPIDEQKWRASPGCTLDLTFPHPARLGPDDSGFITMGDNNACFDQTQGRARPVRADWVLGKARGELPWIGVIKLQFSDWLGPSDNVKQYVPSDVRVMMWVSVGAIVGVPFIVEYGVRWWRTRKPGEGDPPE